MPVQLPAGDERRVPFQVTSLTGAVCVSLYGRDGPNGFGLIVQATSRWLHRAIGLTIVATFGPASIIVRHNLSREHCDDGERASAKAIGL
jgi:ribosomal protein S5